MWCVLPWTARQLIPPSEVLHPNFCAARVIATVAAATELRNKSKNNIIINKNKNKKNKKKNNNNKNSNPTLNLSLSVSLIRYRQ